MKKFIDQSKCNTPKTMREFEVRNEVALALRGCKTADEKRALISKFFYRGLSSSLFEGPPVSIHSLSENSSQSNDKVKSRAVGDFVGVLPPHPRDVSRNSNEVEESMMALMGCLRGPDDAAPDLSSLIKTWRRSMVSYSSIMKIGIPLGDWDDGAPVHRLSLAKDGKSIQFDFPVESGKDAVKISCDTICGVDVAPNPGGVGFNAVNFWINVVNGGERVRLGPFSPPTDLELRAWVLVLSTISTQQSTHTSAHVANFQSVGRMVLGEISKKMPFCDALNDVQSKIDVIVGDNATIFPDPVLLLG